MPAYLFKRVNLDLYYPPFLAILLEVKARASARGCDAYSLRGFSTMAQQFTLRQKFLNGTGGKAAPAGASGHNYGLADDSAVDSDLIQPGLQPTWDAKKYAILGEEAQKAGLVWGMSFGDCPHVQWPGFVSGTQLQPLRQIWTQCPAGASDSQKLRAVWQYLDSLPSPIKQ